MENNNSKPILMQNSLPCQVTLKLGFVPDQSIISSPSSQSLLALSKILTANHIVTPTDQSRIPGQLFGNKPILGSNNKVIIVTGLDLTLNHHFIYSEIGLLLKIWDQIQQQFQSSNKSYRLSLRCFQVKEGALDCFPFEGANPGGASQVNLFEVSSRQQMLLLMSQLTKVNLQRSSLATEVIVSQATSLKRLSIFLVQPSHTLVLNQQLQLLLRELTNSQDISHQKKDSNSQKNILFNLLSPVITNSNEPLQILLQIEKEENIPNSPLIPILQYWSQKSSNYVLAQELSQEIVRHEAILSRIRQKHKTVLGVLSKCMGIDCCQFQRKYQLALDSLGSGPRDKFRLATQKRQQNEDLLQKIERSTFEQEAEICSIHEQHALKLQQLHKHKKQLVQDLTRLIRDIQELTNPQIHTDPEPATNSIYSRPKHKLKPKLEEEEDTNHYSFVSGHLITHKSLKHKSDKKEMFLQTFTRQEPINNNTAMGSSNLIKTIRKEQILSEIDRLMRLVIKQEELMQNCLSKRNCQLSAKLKWQFKESYLESRLSGVGQLLKMNRDEGRFTQWMQAQQGFRDWMQRRQVNIGCGTMTTIREL